MKRFLTLFFMFSLVHSALLRGQWFIDLGESSAYVELANQYLLGTIKENPEQVLKNRQDTAPFLMLADGAILKQDDTEQDINSFLDKAPQGSIPIIQVKGATMKNDYCGFPGTNTLASWIQKADNHPNTIGSILYMDTPGGNADGPAMMHDTIFTSKKPIVGFIDGLCASAGVFIGSGCKYLIANSAAAMVGSIGTMSTLTDMRKRQEMMGLKEVRIVSDLSPNKNLSSQQAMDGNTQPYKDEFLNPLTQVFHSYVVKGRGGKLKNTKSGEAPLDGKMYMAEMALEYGLIDKIGTMADAVAMVKELSNKNQGIYKLS